MLGKEHMESRISNRMEEMEGVRRTTGISSIRETKKNSGYQRHSRSRGSRERGSPPIHGSI